MRTLLALALGLCAISAVSVGAAGLPVSRLAGGANDCLASLDLLGTNVRAKAKTVVCHDGSLACDRDGLVNGHCQFWTRVCVDDGGTCGAVDSVSVDADPADNDLVMLGRTLEHVTMPSAGEACGAVTTLTVQLAKRANGSARQARKRVAWRASGVDGGHDDDAVTFVCKPPVKEKRRGGISFARIQKQVFEKNCAFSGCHGVDNPQADLQLVGDGVYENLVDKVATASAAQFAGKKRVVPGAPETSFLMDKLEGKLGPGEGDPMPLDRKPLSADTIETLRKWILAGAPKERVITGGLIGESDTQPRIPVPPAPTGGFQAHMTPFMLGDRPETEGCQMVRLGNPEDIDVGQWELLMHEGSHHFILRAFRCTDAAGNDVDRDHDGVNDCDEDSFDAQFPTGFAPCEQFGYGWAFMVGAQTPHYLVDYQTAETGVAVHLRKNQPLLLNSHYTNPFADTMAEVWVNVTPVDPALVTHRARILFEEIANVFIKVPPGTESHAATYLSCAFRDDAICGAAGEPHPTVDRYAFLGMVSHMHKRSQKFVADLSTSDGTRVLRSDDMTDTDDGTSHLYVSTDYDDPINRAFWPPIVIEKGQTLDYTCYHENGVHSPVRLGCEETPGVPPGKSILEEFGGGSADIYGGASKWCRTDADCAGVGTGRCVPANLVFGELADDDMCILPGLFYDCPATGPCYPGEPPS
jgi:hypothetical protein